MESSGFQKEKEQVPNVVNDAVGSGVQALRKHSSKVPAAVEEAKVLASKIDLGKLDLAGTPLADKKLFKEKQREIYVALAMGIIFGFVLEKSRVFDPRLVIAQFKLRSMLLWKVHLVAAAVAFGVRAGLAFVVSMKDDAEKSVEVHVKSPRGLYAVVVGGLLFGVGVSMCGADPALLAVQLGTGVFYALFTLVGVLVGSMTFNYVKHAQPVFDNFLTMHSPTENQVLLRNLHPMGKKLPLWQFRAAMAGVCFVMFVLLTILYPTNGDLVRSRALSKTVVDGNSLRYALSKAFWGPLTTGVFLGLLVVPAMVLLKEEINIAKAYSVLVSILLKVLGPTTPFGRNLLKKIAFEEAADFKAALSSEFRHFWPVVFVAGALGGGFVSALLSRHLFPTLGYQVGMFGGFVGGFIMIFGARMTGSGGMFGIGVVSTSTLDTRAFLAAIAMAVGGILAASMRASR